MHNVYLGAMQTNLGGKPSIPLPDLRMGRSWNKGKTHLSQFTGIECMSLLVSDKQPYQPQQSSHRMIDHILRWRSSDEARVRWMTAAIVTITASSSSVVSLWSQVTMGWPYPWHTKGQKMSLKKIDAGGAQSSEPNDRESYGVLERQVPIYTTVVFLRSTQSKL